MRTRVSEVLVAVLLLTGCSASAPDDSASDGEDADVVTAVSTEAPSLGIRNTGWLLKSGSVDDQPIPVEPDLVMRFEEDRLTFPLACNSASVPYVVEGASIELDVDYFATTDMRCAPGPAERARLFESALLRADTLTLHDGGQRLELRGDDAMLLFTRGTGG